MSVLDEIRKLDEQKKQLLGQAKKEALDAANKAVRALNELGFNYRLIEDTDRTGSRRTGIREQVLQTVKGTTGISRADLLTKLGARGDKAQEQSVSNALSALKKAGTLTLTNGQYRAK